jgi:hypothetical protein
MYICDAFGTAMAQTKLSVILPENGLQAAIERGTRVRAASLGFTWLHSSSLAVLIGLG